MASYCTYTGLEENLAASENSHDTLIATATFPKAKAFASVFWISLIIWLAMMVSSVAPSAATTQVPRMIRAAFVFSFFHQRNVLFNASNDGRKHTSKHRKVMCFATYKMYAGCGSAMATSG